MIDKINLYLMFEELLCRILNEISRFLEIGFCEISFFFE